MKCPHCNEQIDYLDMTLAPDPSGKLRPIWQCAQCEGYYDITTMDLHHKKKATRYYIPEIKRVWDIGEGQWIYTSTGGRYTHDHTHD